MIGPLFFLTAIFFFNFLARIILSPLMPVVETDLNLDHGQAGGLFMLLAAGYFVALMVSGYVSSRLHHNRTIVVSALAMGLALVGTSLSQSLGGLCLGILGVGLTAGFYFPSGMATITSLFEPKHWGRAIGVHELAPNLAFLSAPLFAELLLQWFSWRHILALTGLASILLGAAFACCGRGGEFPGEAPALSFLRNLFREPVFWIMLVLFGLGMSASTGVYSMLPLFLVAERGMDPNQANLIVALSRLPTLGTAILGGWASDRLGPGATLTAILLATGTMTLLVGLVPTPWLIVFIVLQATVAVGFFPPAFAAVSSLGMAGSRNVVISFTIPFAYVLGAGVTPILIGICGNEGAFAFGIGLVGVFIILGAGISKRLKLPAPHRKSVIRED